MTTEFTLIEDGIHRPDEPRHFMTIKPARGEFVVQVDGTEIARSKRCLQLDEVGKGIYGSTFYFNRVEVNLDFLTPSETTSHCPLKGQTSYFSILLPGRLLKNAAWSYTILKDFDKKIEQIKDLIAFDLSMVELIRLPS